MCTDFLRKTKGFSKAATGPLMSYLNPYKTPSFPFASLQHPFISWSNPCTSLSFLLRFHDKSFGFLPKALQRIITSVTTSFQFFIKSLQNPDIPLWDPCKILSISFRFLAKSVHFLIKSLHHPFMSVLFLTTSCHCHITRSCHFLSFPYQLLKCSCLNPHTILSLPF